jgi:hypothetical protein
MAARLHIGHGCTIIASIREIHMGIPIKASKA